MLWEGAVLFILLSCEGIGALFQEVEILDVEC